MSLTLLVKTLSLVLLMSLIVYGLLIYVTESRAADSQLRERSAEVDGMSSEKAGKKTRAAAEQQPDSGLPHLPDLQSLKASCWHVNFSPPSPIDHTPNPFLIDHPSLCSGDVFLLLVVHSGAPNRDRRDLIRSTWGSVRNFNGDRLVTVFFVGTSSDPSVTEALKREADTQADLVQADFVDSYRNLTYKHLYWIKWVTQNCRSLKFVMKADDDVMINVFHLHQSLTERVAGWKMFFDCWVNTNGPMRDQTAKWYVTREEWPVDKYPSYCNGPGFLVSADVIPLLHVCAKWRKVFWLEDVFVSGALAEALGIERIPWPDGWAAEDMHPKLAGPDVDTVVLITELGNTVMNRLHRKVWQAMLKYSYY